MAKELPYFKFEPNQWENGNIQICDSHDKGLFIDLCSIYWSRIGDLPLKLAVKKLCGGDATAFDSLIKEKIFAVIDGMICIDFLNEQLEEFEAISKTNSENARLGWEKRRKKATAKRPQSDRNAIREEKRREEERREEGEGEGSPALVSGKNLEQNLLSDPDLQMLIQKNTNLSGNSVVKKIKEFAEREQLNGGRSLKSWKNFCYQSILKNHKSINGKPKNRNR